MSQSTVMPGVILNSLPEALAWLRAQGAQQIQIDSRRVQPGDAFLAWPGAAQDGRAFVGQALVQGAVACLVDAGQQSSSSVAKTVAEMGKAQVATLPNLKNAAGLLAADWYKHPSREVGLMAVTGTNGKTSTAWWLAQALAGLPAPWGRACGVMGTLGNGVLAQDGWLQPLQSTGLTTPDPITVQRTLREWVDQGVQACALEASSIGLNEQRLAGSEVRVAIFTNFTQDHLDYHGDMATYWAAKRSLFDAPGLKTAVINVDDEKGRELVSTLSRDLALWTVSADVTASSALGGHGPRLLAQAIAYRDDGLCFEVVEIDPVNGAEVSRAQVQTQLIGRYNISNLLGVLATLRSLEVPLAVAVQALAGLTPVPGRMQCLDGAQEPPIERPYVVVDYAHTPDALSQTLGALRELAGHRGGQLWCLFGCGGDRDASKRPLMGMAAHAGADRVVLTSDNPRSEDPETIAQGVLQGLSSQVKGWQVELDRARAIDLIVAQASPRDVVLLAGKGHETTQDVRGVKSPFSDVVQASLALATHWGFFNLREVAQALSATPLTVGAELRPLRVHTDTRSLQPGDLFVALRGERFDAHDYLVQARAAGAVGAVVACGALPVPLPEALVAWPLIEVSDTQQALGQLATAWRARFHRPLIAVTGSNGKTTVTQMLASVLEVQWPQARLATQGNFNNEIGLPLTLLRWRAEHQAAVVELGMNHPGEIARLAAITQPTVALVNNAQREHQEFMGTVDAVALENGQVFQHLTATGVAVFPADEPYAALWQGLAKGQACLRFSATPGVDAEVSLLQAEWLGERWQARVATPVGELNFGLALAGRHNLRNALAVIACSVAAGVPLSAVAQGLADFKAVNGRSRAWTIARGQDRLTVVDDSYNANPDSVRAAIDLLASLPAPRLLVLGDMGEVGDQGPAFHAEAGAYAQACGIESLFTMGELSRASADAFSGARHFDDIALLNRAVQEGLPALGSLLIKGSRFMKMERVVEALPASLNTGSEKYSKDGLTCS